MNQHKINSSFFVIVSVFFFWGFVAASNSILIPLFKEKFHLSQFQSQLVDFAFYAAYFIGALIYFALSLLGGDPLNRIGYKKGLIYGLLLSAAGSLIFIPAANQNSYPLLLLALFVIGLGFALQQIVANPFVVNFGHRKTGAQRLNLAGGINSLGTTIGPVILSFALFGSFVAPKPETMGIESVKVPAYILFALFVLCALLITLSKLPQVSSTEIFTKDLGAFKFPQLTLGMIAIFMYVGVEVTIQSNMAALLKMPEIKGLDHRGISHFISLYWGSLMIGRWTGSISVFQLSKTGKILMQSIVPVIALLVVYMVNYLRGSDVSDFNYYIPFVIGASILLMISGDNPAKTLLILASAATVMMIVGLLSSGNLALYSFISGGLFCSVMFPCIFSLAINGLGKYTNQGSSLLIMMILGGAIIPPFQGWLADVSDPHSSYGVTVFCFAYLAWYAFRVRNIKRVDDHLDAAEMKIQQGH
jgi:MFS transporter, FHS family, L-fucose permease